MISHFIFIKLVNCAISDKFSSRTLDALGEESQINGCICPLVDGFRTFVGRHIRIYVPWTASIDNNVFSGIGRKLALLDLCEDTHPNFRHAISTAGVTFLLMLAIFRRLDEIVHQGCQLFDRNIWIQEFGLNF